MNDHDPEPVSEIVAPLAVVPDSATDKITALSMERVSIDIAVSTAKNYPRILENVIREAKMQVTNTPDTARKCFYQLERMGEGGQKKVIEGPSIRMAEIFANAWGNIRWCGCKIAEGERFVTSRGVCHDLQKNVLVVRDVDRRITNKYGKRYSDDMIATTANAATSIAMRNALLSVVPRVYINQMMETAKKVWAGDEKSFQSRISACLKWFNDRGIENDRVFEKLEVKGARDLNMDHLIKLGGLVTAIEEHDTTIEEEFPEPKKASAPAPAPKPEAVSDNLNFLIDQIADLSDRDGIVRNMLTSWLEEKRWIRPGSGLAGLTPARASEIVTLWDKVSNEIKAASPKKEEGKLL